MPSGLQVWDANGRVLFDSNSNTTKIVGSVNTGTSGGSITVPEFTLGQGWAAVNKINTDTSNFDDLMLGNFPAIEINGNTLSWSFLSFDIDKHYYWYLEFSSQNLDVEIIYGVYV